MHSVESYTVCDTHPIGRLRTVRDKRKKGKCCRKEGLIEDDKELDTESQLEKRKGGQGQQEEVLGRI